ncbi:MAG TPA: ABC transporter permease [Firmicutes bacterium]|nr:ABC transporter permease [Bacillota bacterium]
MNYFRRALISIARKIPKTLILLLIVLILGNIMLSSLLIVQSVDGTKDAVLKELPPIVSLSFNFEKLNEMMMKGEDFGEIKWLSFDDLDNIAAACGSYIKSYDYAVTTGMQTTSLERAEREGSSYPGFGMPAFTFSGAAIPMFALLESGEAEIVSGRTFTEQELAEGRPVLIMSEQLAEQNNYVVGDTVTIENTLVTYTQAGEEKILDTLVFDFDLVGIIAYKNLPAGESEQTDFFGIDTEWERVNTLITPNNFIRQYNEMWMEINREYYQELGMADFFPEEYNPLMGGTTSITYILNSSEDFESFIKRSQDVLNNEWYLFTSQEDNFQKVAQPLESMKNILNYAFYITLGSSIVVLALVLFAFIRDRKKEIGIYLALGERKSNIVLQLVLESLIIGIIGATLAVGTGVFIASMISDAMLPDQLTIEEEFNPMIPVVEDYLAKIDYSSVLQSFDIGLDIRSTVAFYIAIVITIILAQLIASTYILSFDPKKIMM